MNFLDVNSKQKPDKLESLQNSSFVRHPNISMFARISRWTPSLLPSSVRLLMPQTRRSLHLNPDQINQKIDDQIRSIFHKEAAAVVEEVIAARRGIWGGMNGRECFGELQNSVLRSLGSQS